MTFRMTVPEFVYLPTAWAHRVDLACRGWMGTKYMLNQCCRGVAVDCIHFVAAVLDEMYGWSRAHSLRSLRGDACLHNRPGVQRAIRAMLETYPKHTQVEDRSLEAGDVVVLGPQGGGPGHVLIASLPGVLWEAASTVRATGYGLFQHEQLLAVYRATDKHLWLS